MGNDKQGLLSNWIEIARNKKLSDYKIEKLKRPGVEIRQPECTQGIRNNDDNSSPPQSPPRRQRRQRNDSTNPFRDAFEILGLQPNATERGIRVRFRQLSRKYHPDKHQQSETGMSDAEATEHFQKANNAQEALINHLRSNPPT